VKLQHLLEYAALWRSPFAQLSSDFPQLEHEDPDLELTWKINWYLPDASAGFDCDLLVERLQDYFSNDVPGSLHDVARNTTCGYRWENCQWAALVMLFRPFWIRKPSTWEGDTRESLLRHLFVRYDVPEFLFKEWRDIGSSQDNHFVWNLWFISFLKAP